MINAVVIFSSSNSKKEVASQNTEIATIDEYSQLSAAFYDYEK
jgi:hypothetical protein